MPTYLGPSSVPYPWTYTPGSRMTATRLTFDYAAAIDFLLNPPLYSGTQASSAQNVPQNTWTWITWDTDTVDTWGGHSTSTNNTRYYAPVSGWYLITGSAGIANATNIGCCVVGVRATQNGVQTTLECSKLPGAAGQGCAPLIGELVLLRKETGDYVEIGLFQQQNPSATDQVEAGPIVNIRWVAAASGTTGLPVPAPAAWPVPPAYVTSAFLNSYRDAIRFLTYPPIARLTTKTARALASTAWPTPGPALTWETATVDNYGGWSSATPTRYTAPCAGRYFVQGQMSMDTAGSGTGGARVLGLRINGGAIQWCNGEVANAAGTVGLGHATIAQRMLRLNAGDYVEVLPFQGGSASVNLLAGRCKLIMVWLGS